MNTDRAVEQGSVSAQELRPASEKILPLSRLRRLVMLGIIVLFLLQFLRIKFLVGGLTGSIALWFVNLIDIFAFLKNLCGFFSSFQASRGG